jgi:hypothetical protein
VIADRGPSERAWSPAAPGLVMVQMNIGAQQLAHDLLAGPLCTSTLTPHRRPRMVPWLGR